jgi:o-succinylbenzoate synthase
VPVALDEELIGYDSIQEKQKLLQQLQPAFLVLKPSLHGGMMGCRDWIDLAKQHTIGWWTTSYLESAIGLNAIAQFTSEYSTSIFHGLGTGQIYTQTIPSPLEVRSGTLMYNRKQEWGNPLNLA